MCMRQPEGGAILAAVEVPNELIATNGLSRLLGSLEEHIVSLRACVTSKREKS